MSRYTAVVASDTGYQLGEGPTWDPLRKWVYWVDIAAGQVWKGRLDGAGTSVIDLHTHQFDHTVSAIAPAYDGRLLVAGDRRLLLVDRDGDVHHGPQVISSAYRDRFNDGKCDLAGNFVVGTLSLDGSRDHQRLLHHDGSNAHTIDDDLGMSNGLAWSPDGDTFYSIDTVSGCVWSRPYDARAARWGQREPLFHVSDALPDGMCVDSVGNLWIALWGAGQVRRYTPAGEVLDIVSVAAPHTSSVCFVGDRLDALLITTARDGLTGSQLQQYPLSGRLFMVKVETPGAPTAFWNGNLDYVTDGV